MAFKIKGTVVHIAEPKEGISKLGKAWNSQDFTIQHGDDDRFLKFASFTLFGEKTKYMPAEGELVEVNFDIDARKWQEKYFTTLNAFSVFTDKGSESGSSSSKYQDDYLEQITQDKDDLPF